MSAATPILEFQAVDRSFDLDGQEVTVLKGIDLTIEAGELIAIMGQSGSGKSTLLNILGCLMRPSGGNYRVFGQDVAALDDDALARLRRERFGFVFQRYFLIGNQTAAGNVEVPAVYAGVPREARHARARWLLDKMGVLAHAEKPPQKLSSGQQQRVAIARSLTNGGQVILADQPTGALDSATGAEVMALLLELNRLGHTVILVTHDSEVACHARRVVEIRDGCIVRDTRAERAATSEPAAPAALQDAPVVGEPSLLTRLEDALRTALHAMRAHRLRTLLTTLGIAIGVASVVSVNSLGEGGREKVDALAKSVGTKQIFVQSTGAGAHNWTLSPADMAALEEQPFVVGAIPSLDKEFLIRYRDRQATTMVSGTTARHLLVQPNAVLSGIWFRAADVVSQAQVIVIDEQVRDQLFGDDEAEGKVVLLGTFPCVVVGVVAKRDDPFGQPKLQAWVPYTVSMNRLVGQRFLNGMKVAIDDETPSGVAAQFVENLMLRRHPARDFKVVDSSQLAQQASETVSMINLVFVAIAAISLIVGGIGIMNIMLVSVQERTREIGVRMAVGARRRDIRDQFLVESALVCLAGGIFGVLLAVAVSLGLGAISKLTLQISPIPVIVACLVSALVGVGFGYAPARRAARLEPYEALAYE